MLIQNSHHDVETPTGTMRVHIVSPKCVQVRYGGSDALLRLECTSANNKTSKKLMIFSIAPLYDHVRLS